MQGKNCLFFADKNEYYVRASELVDNAKFEILTFNDYFNASDPVLGTNTPGFYYEAIEKKLKKESKNQNFKFSTIYHVSEIKKDNLSENLRMHSLKLLEIEKSFLGKLYSIRITGGAKFKIYISFTIIDRKYLRITLHGVSGDSAKQLSTSGGLIFLENNNLIVSEFEKWFSIIENNSTTVDLQALLNH